MWAIIKIDKKKFLTFKKDLKKNFYLHHYKKFMSINNVKKVFFAKCGVLVK